MAVTDFYNSIDIRPGFPAITTPDDTASVSAIIDRQNYDGVLFLITTGALTDINATSTALLEEGDDSGLSDAAAVADADMFGTEALAAPIFSNDDTVFKLGYRGTKRYVRLTLTPSGNTGDWPVACPVVLFGGRKPPYTSQSDNT